MKTVGIGGGAGFIGSYITKRFLAENFKVKASTTDVSNRDKYVHLLDLENAENLEIVGLDLREIETVKKFVEGCQIIVHTGTPIQLEVQDLQTELFEPTVKGTENLLEILKNTAGLEKVIFVASVGAWNTSFPMLPEGYESNHIFTENDAPYFGENDLPYAQAKYLADQTVRKFTSENDDLGFEIVTISPVFVIGSHLSNKRDSSSLTLLNLIKNKVTDNPFVGGLFAADPMLSMVDVRDVAESVLQAAVKPNLHGKNYLIANESYKISDISLMLNNQPPASNAAHTYSNALAKNDLGINFISAGETLKSYSDQLEPSAAAGS
jgi:nucleoside-diphosphate-sugar epimerase